MASENEPMDSVEASHVRSRFLADGFVHLKRFLPRSQVLALRAKVIGALQAVSWLLIDPAGQRALPGDEMHHDSGRRNGQEVIDPTWRRGYRAVQSLEPLHAIAHDARLLEVVGMLLGPRVIVHPRKIARISFPGTSFPTPPHQDCLFNRPAVDVLTAWIPLGDYDEQDGTLRLLSGSPHWGPLELRESEGLGGEAVDVGVDDPRWIGGDYEAGDVVLFHSFTVHMAPANRGSQVRLSLDARYQTTGEAIKPQALLPHHFTSQVLPAWHELTAGWSSTRWVEVPLPVRVATVVQPSHRPSRLFPPRRDPCRRAEADLAGIRADSGSEA